MGLLHKSRNQMKKLFADALLQHSLNFAVGDTIKNNPLLIGTLNMAYEITKLIKKSPKREAEFHRKQTEFRGHIKHDFQVYGMDSPIPKISYPTRWTVQAASLSAILKNNGTLMKLWGWAQDNVICSDMKARIRSAD